METSNFALVYFLSQQSHAVLRLELLSSLSKRKQVIKVGDKVNAKESDNSLNEEAKVIFLGTYEECEGECDSILKTQTKLLPSLPSSSKKKSTKKDDSFLLEIAELKKKLKIATDDFDKLQSKCSQQKKLIIEKDAQISLLECEIDKLKEHSDNMQCIQEEPIKSSEVMNCASCNTVSSDIAEMKAMLFQVQQTVTILSSSKEDSDSATSNMIRMTEMSRILVSRTRFIHANTAATGKSFCTKMLTSVFSYDEVIGATLTGIGLPKENVTEKRNFDEMNESIELSVGNLDVSKKLVKTKMLSVEKVADLIDCTSEFYKTVRKQDLRTSITEKLAKLNRGKSSKMDLVDWNGYDPEHFNSLKTTSANLNVPKKSNQNVELEDSSTENSLELFTKMA